MNNEELNNALNEISDKHLSEAETYKRNRHPYWITAVAAILALVILISLIPGRPSDPGNTNMEGSRASSSTNSTPSTNSTSSAPPLNLPPELYNLAAAPAYPEMLREPKREGFVDYDAYREAYNAWCDNQNAQYDQPEGYAESLTGFFQNSIREFLTGDENAAYSPLSAYLALAMLAETTGGNSRQQILDLLGLDSVEELRTQVNHVWNAHYCADGSMDLLLANSLWLDEAYSFHQSTLDNLASHYYAASFHGDLGTPEMDGQLRLWLNHNTGGLLYDQLQNLSMHPNTVFALASTVFFVAEWELGNRFSEKSTTDGTFHSEHGDLTVPFMKQTFDDTYYWGSSFTAVRLRLVGNNNMWLILPDEGVSMAQVLESDEYLQMTLDPEHWKYKLPRIEIHLSLPKFDVSSDLDMIEGMKNLGITDVFDYNVADFTPLSGTPLLYVNSAKHSARVAIDEIGCVGAAYTVIQEGAGGAPPEPFDEIDFVLDRPFLFVVSSRDDLPLFVGTVTEP